MENKKTNQLKSHAVDATNEFLTTNHGVKINNNHHSLKSNERGSTLLEDFITREKLAHFDRERIPERVVHARGTGAHGVFKLHQSLKEYTTAKLFTDTTVETPLFIRFSTVAGFRGSTDLARDVRGFAVKFYTQEGNFDLVGNNIPVFFIQDAIKFPDLVHAVKPEQDNEMPQAGSAHDTFWDFISLMPESIHMVLWAMSDRAIPRSYRMMEGFGVHTYRLVNEEGKAHFVKFHFKPKLGVHSVAWDEAQKISGKDSDFHRRDLYDAILEGNFPEWDFGVQIITEEKAQEFDFDILDPTKLVPEELVPVQIIGSLKLTKAPDNFFAEVEQVAFSPANIIPGLDFSEDPLLQGRLFSYTDTQFHRLGTSNFSELPINRPINQVHNNLRDGFYSQKLPQGKVNYSPNTLGGGCPFQAKAAEGGFTSYPQSLAGTKTREKSEKFFDHFSQAILFYQSQSEFEKQHIKDAFSFELSKLIHPAIQQRMVNNLTNVDIELAQYVASKIGVELPEEVHPYINHAVPADKNEENYQSTPPSSTLKKSQALSMATTIKTAKTRVVALLITDGFDHISCQKLINELKNKGAKPVVVADKLGLITSSTNSTIEAEKTFFNFSSVLVDAVAVIGGEQCIENLSRTPDAIDFINETFKHCKAISFDPDSDKLINRTQILHAKEDGDAINGVTEDGNVESFIKNVEQYRFWEREKKNEKVLESNI